MLLPGILHQYSPFTRETQNNGDIAEPQIHVSGSKNKYTEETQEVNIAVKVKIFYPCKKTIAFTYFLYKASFFVQTAV